jgi:hypothetical protein
MISERAENEEKKAEIDDSSGSDVRTVGCSTYAKASVDKSDCPKV